MTLDDTVYKLVEEKPGIKFRDIYWNLEYTFKEPRGRDLKIESALQRLRKSRRIEYRGGWYVIEENDR